MYLTEQHIIARQDSRYKQLDHICFLSKNLYNAGLYMIKQEFLRSGKWLRAGVVNRKMLGENNPDHKAISGSSAQQILMSLDNNLKSYFSAIKAWKRDNKKFTGCPKFPRYKDKVNGRNVFIYSYAQFKHKNGYIHFPKKEGLQPLKTNCPEGSVKQVRIVPKCNCYVIELSYVVEDIKLKEDNNRVMALDLGVNNLAAITTNTDNETVLVDGKRLKSINQYYNKKRAKLTSKLKKVNGREKSKRINGLTLKRNNKVKDYLHKASKYVVNLAAEKDITTIIVGYNDGWKHKTDMGKRNNQNFVNIPFSVFINMLKYKSERQGLRFITVDESHTSKCSSYDLETIEHHDVYAGKRVKRGLFRTKNGVLLNADINGSYNIMRKVRGDAILPPHTGFGYNPVKVYINECMQV